MDFFEDDSPSKLKMAVIAGASEALKLRAGGKKANDEEIIREIASKVSSIVRNLD